MTTIARFAMLAAGLTFTAFAYAQSYPSKTVS